ncbi:S26 family signal peptidase, partial [Vibrio cholerae]|uniref:S26 family signal peptidase n=1 Tax=Vibrio cholerae TaxID=666 RepID=UPI001F0B2CF2
VETGKPERGDIVVFKYPVNPEIDYIKRVVGMPGDTVRYSAGRFVQQVVGGAGAAKEGFAESFGQSMSKLAQMTPEQRDQFIEDT